MQEWSTDNFNGLMLNISDSDEGTYREYRCLLSYIGSNLLVLGGGASFFIAVEGINSFHERKIIGLSY